MTTHDVMHVLQNIAIWLASSKPSELMTGIASLLTPAAAFWAVYAAKHSGLLDAKRLELAASKAHLEVDKLKLEEEKAEIQSQINAAMEESARYQIERAQLATSVDALNREIASLLQERDVLGKERDSLRDRIDQYRQEIQRASFHAKKAGSIDVGHYLHEYRKVWKEMWNSGNIDEARLHELFKSTLENMQNHVTNSLSQLDGSLR